MIKTFRKTRENETYRKKSETYKNTEKSRKLAKMLKIQKNSKT